MRYRCLIVDHLAQLRREMPVRVLVAMPGNVGDQLIWAGTNDLLAAAGVSPRPLPAGEVHATVARDECLVIPGSGALTAIWHEGLPRLVADAADRFARVVLLPSQFDATVPVVAAALSRPNVFAFAREPRSFNRIRRFGRAALAFDPALFAERLPGTRPAPPARAASARLIAFREDPASLLAAHGCRPNPRVNHDIGRLAPDLDGFLAAVQTVDEVVTDRLHVTVAAAMSGRRVRYIDPHDHKISTYVAFVFRNELGDRIRPCSVDWLLEHGLVDREARPCGSR